MRYLINLIKRTSKMVHPRERKVVMHNVAALSTLQVITYALPIVIIPYLFRALGAEKFGLIAFAQALVQYFMIFTDYGFSITATKEISLCQDEHTKTCKAFSSVMIVKILLAFLSFLMLVAIVYFIPKFRKDWLVYVLSFGAVVGNTLFPVWFFQGKEKMKYITILNTLGGIAYAVFIFLFVKSPDDYIKVVIINSSVFLITGLLGQYVVFDKFKIAFKFEGYKSVGQQLKAGWDIFISIAAINAYTNTRVFILGLLTNNSITGFYSIAEKIASACQTFPLDSFSQAIFPRLNKIFQKNKIKAYAIMQRLQHITTLISSLLLPVVFIFAPMIMRIACGGYYRETVTSLRLLLISVFFVAINAFRVQFLVVCGKTHIFSRIHVIMAMLGLPLMFLLIYSFSYKGAALATITLEAGIFFITYITVRKLKFAQ
ncbi:MAG: flippase [Candidatus Omnitrophica bacterium]|nr:flippase [Candidatus Omnitrophota bacterium]